MTPLRVKYGIPTAPAMPVIALDLPIDCLDSDEEPDEISPHERFKLFHKLWKTHKKRKSREQQKFTGQVPGTSQKLTGQEPGADEDIKGQVMASIDNVSARLAVSQELIDIDAFNAKYGPTKHTLGEHNDIVGDTSQMSSDYFASVHTPVDNWRQIAEARDALHDERVKLEKEKLMGSYQTKSSERSRRGSTQAERRLQLRKTHASLPCQRFSVR